MSQFKAVAGAHPPKFTEETVVDLKVPLCLLPASSDVDCSPLFVKMKEKGVDGCVHQRFDDMHHGFMGARANFEDENNRKRTSEGVI